MQTTIGPGNGAMILSPRPHNSSKSNAPGHTLGGGHQKTQSMGDVSGIIKNIIAN